MSVSVIPRDIQGNLISPGDRLVVALSEGPLCASLTVREVRGIEGPHIIFFTTYGVPFTMLSVDARTRALRLP